MGTSDESTRGFVDAPVDPARYDRASDDPHEVTGMILALVPEGARVLDVGCGTGASTALIRDRRKAEVVGLEPHPDRARMARDRGLDVRAGVLDAGAAEGLGTFDVVLFMDVLEHMVNPVPALEAARSLLRPGGFVAASIPNVAHWSVRLDLARGRFDYTQWGILDGTHLRWFTAEGVRRLFRAAGFELERLDVTAGVWLEDYSQRRPWYWIGRPWRDRIVRWAAARFPTLFGCQFIVRAIPNPGRVAAPGDTQTA
jgi:methionine biosynthesis protein MetW